MVKDSRSTTKKRSSKKEAFVFKAKKAKKPKAMEASAPKAVAATRVAAIDIQPVPDIEVLPPDYKRCKFLLINAPGSLMVRIKNHMGAPVTQLFRHGSLVPVIGAPPELMKAADNPACFFFSQVTRQNHFKVETVERVVHEDRGVIGARGKESIVSETGVSAPVIHRIGDASPAAHEHVVLSILKNEAGLEEESEVQHS